MLKFVCLKCGKDCYSAAPLKYQTNPSCPYCGGEIKEEPEKASDKTSNKKGLSVGDLIRELF